MQLVGRVLPRCEERLWLPSSCVTASLGQSESVPTLLAAVWVEITGVVGTARARLELIPSPPL